MTETIAASALLDASILIVDDRPANVELLDAMLRQAGYTRVASTTDPRAVAALHREQRYDLILLDLEMPAMDGFDVIEALKAGADDGYVPVIAITAHREHKVRALQAGAKDFIGKPFDLCEIESRIRNMLEVRLLYRKLADDAAALERTVQERTAALRESEARYRSLTELASDWYWEQDEHGAFTRVSGPVQEMLGIRAPLLAGDTSRVQGAGWNEAERAVLQGNIAARRPFLNFIFSRTDADGTERRFQVSGEPMFNEACRFVGYRGIGVELIARV
ncbi:MAG: response regulator [Betaproteobacteria bacterium]